MKLNKTGRTGAIVMLVLLGLGNAGCDYGSPTGVPSDDPLEPTLSSIQAKILTPSCALSGCHAGGNPSAGLNLEPGNAFGNLVNVSSVEVAAQVRVAPGDADNSYLFRKITGAAGISGRRMPIGGNLSGAQIDAVREWITAGAQNN